MPRLRQERALGNLPGSVAMKAQKIESYPNSRTIPSQCKAKNRQPTSPRQNALVGAQRRLTPYKNDQPLPAHVKAIQAQIDANTYHVDSTTIAQHMLKSSMARQMLDIEE